MARPPVAAAFPRTGPVVVAMVISIALWAFMMAWSLAYLRRIAGGLEPFDLRPFGYTVEEARAFLTAITAIGRDYYANVQLQLDTAYPALYALSRGLLLLWATAAGRTGDRALPVAIRAALLLLPALTAAFDYLENNAIAAMLAAGAGVSAEIVATASAWTQAKSLAGLVTETTCVILLGIAFVRWRHRRKRTSPGIGRP